MLSGPALVAQGIEHRPPEPGAQVRILPGARASDHLLQTQSASQVAILFLGSFQERRKARRALTPPIRRGVESRMARQWVRELSVCSVFDTVLRKGPL